jgi:hypothetical protein
LFFLLLLLALLWMGSNGAHLLAHQELELVMWCGCSQTITIAGCLW